MIGTTYAHIPRICYVMKLLKDDLEIWKCYNIRSNQRISEEKIERWKLFRLYLNFADLDSDRLKRVRFNDAYRAASYYFKELKGYYISLPLLEFIHLLKKGKKDMAVAKLEEVDNYFYKHLNEPGKNQREKQFFKLINLLKSNDFDVKMLQATV